MPAELYYTPTSCGASNFIAATKAGLIGTKLNAYEVDIRSHTIKNGPNAGGDFYKVNPKGNVPTIKLEDGTILNENIATLSWIADQAPQSGLAPAAGTNERYQLLNKLSIVATEIHKAYGPFFAGPSDEAKVPLYENLRKKLAYLDKNEISDSKKFWMGDNFTVADSYLYVVLTWSDFIGFDLGKEFPRIMAYKQRVADLDFVKEAHQKMANPQ